MNRTYPTRSFLRLAALAVCIALMLGLFCGCGGESDPSTGTTGAAPATTEAATTEKPQTTNATADSETEPVDLGEIVNRDVYTDDEITADDPRLDKVVAVCGETEMNNRLFQIYYCMQYHNFLNEYGMYAFYFGLDTSKPLSAQPSVQEGMTWEQLFAESALEQFRQFGAVTEKAKSEGFTLTGELAQELEEAIAGIADDAKEKGYESVDAYIQESFGRTVTTADFEAFLRGYYYAMGYEDQMYNSYTCTDEDLMEVFMELREENEQYKTVSMDKTNVNVRHILIQPEDTDKDNSVSEAEKAAAKAKAEALLETWKQDPTEENFAALAEQNTSDPGSKDNGGLYEDVYPGQMVAAFNDWCFDSSRKTGDTDVVETDYGYHIMYFVSNTNHYQWKILAQKEYASKRMVTALQEITEAYPTQVDYASLVLAPLSLPTSSEE